MVVAFEEFEVEFDRFFSSKDLPQFIVGLLGFLNIGLASVVLEQAQTDLVPLW